jgi:hypothetical protein
MPTTSRVVLAALVFFVGFYAMLKVVWRFADRMMYFAAVCVGLMIVAATTLSGLHILMGVWPWQ